MSQYSKPYLSHQALVELLESRGMEITDKERALKCLEQVGYYRLSAYWYPNRVSEEVVDEATSEKKIKILDHFKEGSTFSAAFDFYVFDKKLRMLVLDAIERLEIGMRAVVVEEMAKLSAFSYREKDKLHSRFTKPNITAAQKNRILELRNNTHPDKIAEILKIKRKKVDSCLRDPKKAVLSEFDVWFERADSKFSSSKEDFAKHFKDKYPNGNPPIWVFSEVWDFGALSYFFGGLKDDIKAKISSQFGVSEGRVLVSWMRNINDIRNVCAHHSRLWNRNVPSSPAWPQTQQIDDLTHAMERENRFYASACILRYMLRSINPNCQWASRFKALIRDFPNNPHVNLSSAGFPDDWENQPLWKT